MKSNAPTTMLLTRSAVARLATPVDYLACARAAFADIAAQRYVVPEVGHLDAPAGKIHVKSALRSGSPWLAALKINANYPENPSRTGLPTIQGFIALFDADSGCVLALLDSLEITARRTAAATALATQYLAREDARVLALVGAGMQARYHLDALLDVRQIDSVRVCEPRDSAAQALIHYAQQLGIEARRTPDAASAARAADIVVTLTPSRQPLLCLADIDPGTFVAGVGADSPVKHELAPDLLAGSHVVVDLLAQCAAMGDLHHALEGGAMKCTQVYCELAHLAAGQYAGRSTAAERFVFDSTGVAALDLAAAQMIYERAGTDRGVPSILLDDLAG